MIQRNTEKGLYKARNIPPLFRFRYGVVEGDAKKAFLSRIGMEQRSVYETRKDIYAGSLSVLAQKDAVESDKPLLRREIETFMREGERKNYTEEFLKSAAILATGAVGAYLLPPLHDPYLGVSPSFYDSLMVGALTVEVTWMFYGIVRCTADVMDFYQRVIDAPRALKILERKQDALAQDVQSSVRFGSKGNKMPPA